MVFFMLERTPFLDEEHILFLDSETSLNHSNKLVFS